MAKQSKSLRARKPDVRDDSLLLRSAESLGRMIGTLQRQLDIASRQLRSNGNGAGPTDGHAAPRKTARKSSAKPRQKRATTNTIPGQPVKSARKAAKRKSSRAR